RWLCRHSDFQTAAPRCFFRGWRVELPRDLPRSASRELHPPDGTSAVAIERPLNLMRLARGPQRRLTNAFLLFDLSRPAHRQPDLDPRLQFGIFPATDDFPRRRCTG